MSIDIAQLRETTPTFNRLCIVTILNVSCFSVHT